MKNKGLMMMLSLALVAGLFGVLPTPRALAVSTGAPDAPLTAISLTGSTYTQNFDTLVSSGTSSDVPDGWAFSESDTNANSTYTAGTGSGNTGDTYSFGAASSTERALGGLRPRGLVPHPRPQSFHRAPPPVTRQRPGDAPGPGGGDWTERPPSRRDSPAARPPRAAALRA